MTLDLLPRDAARVALDIAVIDDAARALRLAAARLTGLLARAGGASTAASWSAPSADLFAERANEVRRACAQAEATADDAVSALVRARAAVGDRVRP